jgi:hypothetical protein
LSEEIFFVSMVCSNLEGFLQHKFRWEGSILVRPHIVPRGVNLYQEIPSETKDVYDRAMQVLQPAQADF